MPFKIGLGGSIVQSLINNARNVLDFANRNLSTRRLIQTGRGGRNGRRGGRNRRRSTALIILSPHLTLASSLETHNRRASLKMLLLLLLLFLLLSLHEIPSRNALTPNRTLYVRVEFNNRIDEIRLATTRRINRLITVVLR